MTQKENIVIIDYGAGNLRSAAKACEYAAHQSGLDLDVIVSNRAEDVAKATRLLLPGQGAFGDCMAGLSAQNGMIEALEESVLRKGTPFLGICVGMQLLASKGLEHGATAGLGWIAGEVVKMEPRDLALKIPHMGWNNLIISPAPENPHERSEHFVLRSINNSKDYYFVHSFMFKCEYDEHILAQVEYDGFIPAIVGRDNIIGMQFHPEKSQNAGIQLISDFLRWRP